MARLLFIVQKIKSKSNSRIPIPTYNWFDENDRNQPPVDKNNLKFEISALTLEQYFPSF